jgi:ribA/ribD-fused uncharacterized protein
MRAVKQFQGRWRDFSNFAHWPVRIYGKTFPTAEHAFVFAKNPDAWDDEWIKLKPGQIKRKGRKIRLRPDWEEVKLDIMLEICLAKFSQHAELRALLLSTGIAMLIEGNDWHDTFWGICDGCRRWGPHAPIGHNNLGRILMMVRTELRQEG